MQSGPDQLRDWMARRGFDQRKTAAYLGCDETYVSMLVNGKRRPGLDNAVFIEQQTGIPVEAWLLSEAHESDLATPAPASKRKADKA